MLPRVTEHTSGVDTVTVAFPPKETDTGPSARVAGMVGSAANAGSPWHGQILTPTLLSSAALTKSFFPKGLSGPVSRLTIVRRVRPKGSRRFPTPNWQREHGPDPARFPAERLWLHQQ